MRLQASNQAGASRGPTERGSDRCAEAAELRARLDRAGPELLADAEALQLLLAPVGGQAGGLAIRLIDEFGSLPEVLGAAPAELARVAPRPAVRAIRLARDLVRRALEAPLRRRCALTSSSAVHAYLRGVLTGVGREQFRVLFLDRQNGLIADEVMGWGSVDHAPVYPREVVRRALERNASALILAHNHPSGDPTPSSADAAMTGQVVAAARALGITVHDHIIVGGQETVSLRALGMM